jgi:hypothetical protein
MLCAECKQECGIYCYDDSFDHEFGTEYRKHFGSDCCGANIYEYICSSCNGEGCLDCFGIGLTGEVDYNDFD